MHEKVTSIQTHGNYVSHFAQEQDLAAVSGDSRWDKKPQLLPYQREQVGSSSFNLEYFSYSTPSEIRADIVSYLGEYRFQLQKFNYALKFSKAGDGSIGLRDSERGELLQLKARRVLEERKLQGKPIHREESELQGITKLDQDLIQAEDGDMMFWASPPGPDEEGYGNYGFVYAGKIKKNGEHDLELSMTAIRVENPELQGFNKALTMLTGSRVDHFQADEFLSDPQVKQGRVEEKIVDRVLKTYFPTFSENENEKKDFEAVIQRLNPLIEELVVVIQTGTSGEKVKSFQTLENYALRLKSLSKRTDEKGKMLYEGLIRFQKSLQDLRLQYGYVPPTVKGSCGDTASAKESNGLMSNRSKVPGKFGREFTFDYSGPCRMCGKDVLCGPCQVCEGCNDEIDAAELVAVAA